MHLWLCVCSADGVIKVWDAHKSLMTEFTLNSTLSAACFLNNRGDLLVGYNNHIFVIHHSKGEQDVLVCGEGGSVAVV